MDEQRRRELEERRRELQAKRPVPEHDGFEGTVVPRLRALGVAHSIPSMRIWTPPFLEVTSSRIFWEGSPPSPFWEVCKTLDEKVDTVTTMLELVASWGDVLRFTFDPYGSPVAILLEDALPVLDLLLSDAWTIWITSEPGNWLVEVGDYDVVRIALPPEVPADEQQRIADRLAAYAAPLAAAFAQSGATLEYLPRDTPGAPGHVRAFALHGWQASPKSLKALVERGDSAGLEASIRPYVEARAPGAAPLVISLELPDSPFFRVTGADLLAHVDALMKTADRADQDTAGNPLETHMALVYPPDYRWFLKLRRSGPYWRAEAVDYS